MFVCKEMLSAEGFAAVKHLFSKLKNIQSITFVDFHTDSPLKVAKRVVSCLIRANLTCQGLRMVEDIFVEHKSEFESMSQDELLLWKTLQIEFITQKILKSNDISAQIDYLSKIEDFFQNFTEDEIQEVPDLCFLFAMLKYFNTKIHGENVDNMLALTWLQRASEFSWEYEHVGRRDSISKLETATQELQLLQKYNF